MATLIYGTESSQIDWNYRQGVGGFSGGSTSGLYYPYPLPGSVQATYLNKCFDSVSSEWVLWETFFQDRTGTQYPGSGFDSATYKVETIVYQR